MVVEHDPVRRARLAALLNGAPDLELVGTASTTAITHVLLNTLGSARPDVVLVALDLPDEDGSSTTATFHASYPHLRVFTYAEDPAHPLAARDLAAGVIAVLAERTLVDDLRDVLRAAQPPN